MEQSKKLVEAPSVTTNIEAMSHAISNHTNS